MIRQLLHAVALEETALAHLINAQAEKVAALGTALAEPDSFDQVIAFQRTVHEVLQAVSRREEVLLKQLQLILTMARWEDDASGSSI